MLMLLTQAMASVLLLLLWALVCGCSLAQHEYNELDQLGYTCTPGSLPCRAYVVSRGTNTDAALFGVSVGSFVQILPINCTCVSGRSQHNTTYVFQKGDTMYLVSNGTFQGLTTYQAVQRANPAVDPRMIMPGDSIVFPIRCACPSKNNSNIKSLLTYGVVPGDDIGAIAKSWNVSSSDILSENTGIINPGKDLRPFTTLLLPMEVDDPRVLQAKPLPTGSKGRSNMKVGMIVGLTLGVVFLLIPSLLYLAKRRVIASKRKVVESDFEHLDIGLPKRYSYRQMDEATRNFSQKLGRGGFGSVFQGQLPEGKVAIKRLESADQGEKQFKAEVSIIGNVQHFNLVQLKGFCVEGFERLLVYELIQNGSLDQWLFTSGKMFLNWETRLKVALGTARGLAYLHEECRQPILHLDVKPQNILLDDDFNAKVCDFGMSTLMKLDETTIFTTMRGTPGYLAPEWLQATVSEKADVYSYGVVLMELISGVKCLDTTRSNTHFPSWACQRIAQDCCYKEIVDVRLHEELEEHEIQIKYVIDIALRCIQQEPDSRPSMGVIVQMLEGYAQFFTDTACKSFKAKVDG